MDAQATKPKPDANPDPNPNPTPNPNPNQVGAAFVDATLHVVFGLRAAAAPLMDARAWPPVAPDARTPLGAGGVAAELQLLRWQGALFNATAAADGGVAWRAA